jgi:glycosyltransferase involved in cell wall biosynthesis
MPDGSPDLSLVIACFNEAEHLRHSVARLLAVCDLSRIAYEVIFVDDHSTDDTRQILTSLPDRYPAHPLRIHFNKRNLGRGATIQRGLELARAPIAGYLDIDLEVDAVYVHAFYLAVLEGADLVIGRRIFKFSPRSLARVVLTRGYVRIRRAALGLPFEDTEAGSKFFRLASMRPVLAQCRHPGWFWDTEVVTRAHDAGLTIAEVVCLFVRRHDKTSTVRPLPDAWRYLVGLAALRRSRRPGAAASATLETNK